MSDPLDLEWMSDPGRELPNLDATRPGTRAESPAIADPPSAAAADAAAAPPTPSHKEPRVRRPVDHCFRIRLMRFDRPETRTLSVMCGSESTARARAAVQAGREWHIVGVTLL